MSSTFDFINTESEYTHKIGSNVILHLTRTNHAVAIIKFTDDSGNQIAIPPGLTVHSKDYKNNTLVIEKPIDEIYALCWTNDYYILYNKKVILDIKTNRTWNITSC
jgi:hypothetical protein